MAEGNNDEPVTPQEGGEGGADAGSESNLSLEELNQSLGREFKDKDSAVKGIKDTFDFVGKAGSYREAVKTLGEKLNTDEKGVLDFLQKQAEGNENQPPKNENQIDPKDYISREQYERDMFYKDNPDYQAYKSVIDAMATAMGKTAAEVVETDDFKGIYEKAKAGQEAEDKKSVVESSPQLGAATDKITKSREALNEAQTARHSGDVAGANQRENEARKGAVGAVIDAYELDK